MNFPFQSIIQKNIYLSYIILSIRVIFIDANNNSELIDLFFHCYCKLREKKKKRKKFDEDRFCYEPLNLFAIFSTINISNTYICTNRSFFLHAPALYNPSSNTRKRRKEGEKVKRRNQASRNSESVTSAYWLSFDREEESGYKEGKHEVDHLQTAWRGRGTGRRTAEREKERERESGMHPAGRKLHSWHCVL